MGAGDVALLLDGVAEGDALRRGAGGQRHLDFGNRGGVEARAEAGQQLQDFRRRIGLHRIENAGIRHGAGKGVVIVGDDLEVDDEAGAFGSSVAEEVENAGGCGHVRISQKKQLQTSERFANPRDGDVELTNRLLTFRLGLIGNTQSHCGQ